MNFYTELFMPYGIKSSLPEACLISQFLPVLFVGLFVDIWVIYCGITITEMLNDYLRICARLVTEARSCALFPSGYLTSSSDFLCQKSLNIILPNSFFLLIFLSSSVRQPFSHSLEHKLFYEHKLFQTVTLLPFTKFGNLSKYLHISLHQSHSALLPPLTCKLW